MEVRKVMDGVRPSIILDNRKEKKKIEIKMVWNQSRPSPLVLTHEVFAMQPLSNSGRRPLPIENGLDNGADEY